MQQLVKSRIVPSLLCGGVSLFALVCGSAPVEAQQTFFCPNVSVGPPTTALANGFCTNGVTGAFSNAALASQALSDLSQSSTMAATQTTMDAVSTRRRTETERCPDGFERVGGECRRIRVAETAPARQVTAPATTTAPRTAQRSARRQAAPARVAAPAPREPVFYKAPPPPVDPAPLFAMWTYGFGDFEKRTGTQQIAAGGPLLPGPPGPGTTFNLSAESRGTTGGAMSGFDWTRRGVLAPGDGLILGLLTGYTHSELKVTTQSISADPANVPNGSGNLTARLSGPSVGAYVSYFNGGSSGDLTFRADFFELRESFTDVLGFGGVGTVAASGSASTRVNNYTLSGNVNHRIQMGHGNWFEPTAGFLLSKSDYADSAAVLGLADGHLFRLQAGARFGNESFWNDMKVTTTLTGLVYNNVDVEGGFIQTGAFGTGALILNDEGKFRGQGILAVNFEKTNGMIFFVQGDVRGGEDLIGGGGRAGVRIPLGGGVLPRG